MSTGRDLLSAALRKIGAIAAGETMSSEEASDGIAEMTRMLSSWSTEDLLIYAITAETPLTLTPGDSTVTMGTSGDFTNRPMSIEAALIRDGSTDYPLRVRILDEYASIVDKTRQSTYPTDLYDDGGYPQRTLTLYPVPSAAKSLVLWTKRLISAIGIDDTVSLPPGYEDAIVTNLAVRLAPEYGRPVDPMLQQMAIDSKATIKRANHRVSYLKCDPALTGLGRFDIQTGGYR